MNGTNQNKENPVKTFLHEYAALVRRTGIYVNREYGLGMPIPSSSNQMETIEEHIARLYREERLSEKLNREDSSREKT